MLAIKFLFGLVKEKLTIIITNQFFYFSSLILKCFTAIISGWILVLILGNGDTSYFAKQPVNIENLLIFINTFKYSSQLSIVIAILCSTVILQVCISYVHNIIDFYYSKILLNYLKLKCVTLLCEVKLNYYHQNKLTKIAILIDRESARVVETIINGKKIITSSLSIAIFIVLMLLISIKLTLVSLVLIIVTESIKNWLFLRAKQYARVLNRQSERYYTRILDLLAGIRWIKILATEEKEYTAIASIFEIKKRAQINRQIFLVLLDTFNKISIICTISILTISSSYLLTERLVNFAPTLLIYLLILLHLVSYINQLSMARIKFSDNFSSVAIIMDFLHQDDKLFVRSGSLPFSNLKFGINFKNVSFSYPGNERLILNNINFWLPQGKTIALVSSSNISKSTIADLILRLHEPTQGKILIDGKNLKKYDIKNFRRSIGILEENIFLFHKSIAYNITYGLDNISDNELIVAAKKANAYEFITQLPAGFKTQLGDYSITLSAGEKQRIAIARMFLQNPDIAILRESNRDLDLVSKRLVQDAINELCCGRTALIIANRLSTIKNADSIIVLDKGRVLEQGNHQDLLKKNGLYARLYSMQFKDNDQDHQKNLAQKISKTLMRHKRLTLSSEIRNNLNLLLNSLQSFNDNLIDDNQEQEEILDKSYEFAKNLLDSLKKYEKNLNDKYDLK